MEETIVDVLDTWFDSKIRNIHTITPGKVVEYSASTRKAKVQPMIKMQNQKGDNISPNPIDNVPVIFPSTNSFSFQFPLNNGDGVLLLFSESPIGNYLNNSGNRPVDPDDANTHDMTDCIAIPGLWSFPEVPKNTTTNIELTDTNEMIIEHATGKIKIDTTGTIVLQDGTEPYVLGTTLETILTAFLTPISTIVPGTTAQNATALTTIQSAATTLLGVLSTMKSSRIKGA